MLFSTALIRKQFVMPLIIQMQFLPLLPQLLFLPPQLLTEPQNYQQQLLQQPIQQKRNWLNIDLRFAIQSDNFGQFYLKNSKFNPLNIADYIF